MFGAALAIVLQLVGLIEMHQGERSLADIVQGTEDE